MEFGMKDFCSGKPDTPAKSTIQIKGGHSLRRLEEQEGTSRRFWELTCRGLGTISAGASQTSGKGAFPSLLEITPN